jgi:hypothetical protein
MLLNGVTSGVKLDLMDGDSPCTDFRPTNVSWAQSTAPIPHRCRFIRDVERSNHPAAYISLNTAWFEEIVLGRAQVTLKIVISSATITGATHKDRKSATMFPHVTGANSQAQTISPNGRFESPHERRG